MTADTAAADRAARRRFAAELWGVMRANRGRVAGSVALLLAANVATVASSRTTNGATCCSRA